MPPVLDAKSCLQNRFLKETLTRFRVFINSSQYFDFMQESAIHRWRAKKARIRPRRAKILVR